ncbi:hypothetical protein [Coxiella-like endosymbiont]|uniref:hypothetical protein n=1 Tax=Coxiella-like endosymbiont TaxID=1592897 RepID=UPI00272971B7|nr:hypothetical protein [Coxiella-like endosymbiont]
MIKGQRGMCDRMGLAKKASSLLVNSTYKFEFNDWDILFDGMSKVELQLDKYSLVENLFDSSFGEVYKNREHYLKEQIGASARWLLQGEQEENALR